MIKEFSRDILLQVRVEKENYITIYDNIGYNNIIAFTLSDDIETDLTFINLKVGEYVEKFIKEKLNNE